MKRSIRTQSHRRDFFFDNVPFVTTQLLNPFSHLSRVPAATVGALVLACAPGIHAGVDPAGDPSFDSDGIASRIEPVNRWLGYPGGRLCINPSSAREFKIDPMAADLPLDVGAYAGTKVIRMPRVLTAQLVSPQSPADAEVAPPKEVWYPYKIAFASKQSDDLSIDGFDFFPDASPALIRVLKANGPAGTKLRLAGAAADQGTLRAEADGAITASLDGGHYALVFRRLDGEKLVPASTNVTPVLKDGAWALDLPVGEGGDSFAVGFGFATADEAASLALERANGVLEQPVAASLAMAKANMDGLLRKVPVPARFDQVSGVTADRHRLAYYMAWSFLFQSIIDPLPEHKDYPYPQMSLGKGSLWAEGHPRCPATCAWESFLGIQWLAEIDPEFGWNAYVGIMTLVDEEGILGGESLPSRKAHTAWVLHQRKPDMKRLAEVYPAIRRYLLWREKNPRWIWGKDIAPDEKDIEFAASWMVDTEYAIHIAQALGKAEDAAMWRTRQDAMLGSMREWFFRDPEKLHQFYFTDRQVHETEHRNQYRPVMILSALATPRLPDDMRARLASLLDECLKPDAPNGGFAYTKYADNQFVAWGLIDHGMPQARPFIESILRESIICGEFAETIEYDKNGAAIPFGVKPSLFTALNLIEFTWLLNGVRQDSGLPVPCVIPDTLSTP
jgi:hypothetical protein